VFRGKRNNKKREAKTRNDRPVFHGGAIPGEEGTQVKKKKKKKKKAILIPPAPVGSVKKNSKVPKESRLQKQRTFPEGG